MSTVVADAPICPSPAAGGAKPIADPHGARVLRQTQGVIGVVILLGLIGAYLVDPLFAVLPGIIGLGLVMAAFTGVCPMAGLIARMPWNAPRSEYPTPERRACGCGGRCGR